MARVIHITQADLDDIMSPSLLKEQKKYYPSAGHCVNCDAITKVVRRETNFRHVQTHEKNVRGWDQPYAYAVYLKHNDAAWNTPADFVAEIPVTWHMRRQQPFNFVIPGLPARVKKGG